ncbi:MAG: deoxyribose-phosphate aldolase [Chlorobi bacterium]|nr:deoxyribose-phosphate aldolase [Chlorobiota bacterium]
MGVTVDLAGYIDHTLLKQDATAKDIQCLCGEAVAYHFASVCVNPCRVRMAADFLKGSSVKVCTVIGFPLGANETETKAFEARKAIEAGADELDMVLNIGLLKDGKEEFVRKDITAVVQVAKERGAIVKVILETCLLTRDEKSRACGLCKEAGADYVKTSTGFSASGATVEDVELLRREVGADMGVKASGGIRTRQQALDMIHHGATRIGTSSGIAIVQS